MLKDMLFLRPTPDHKNLGKIRSLKNQSSQCPVSITMTIHVILTKIMRQKGCSIAIFVCFAQDAHSAQDCNKNDQKTSNPGHGQHSSIKSLRKNFLVSILVDMYITLLLNRVFLSMNLQQNKLHGKNGLVTVIVLNL